jgi:hypothetical protein
MKIEAFHGFGHFFHDANAVVHGPHVVVRHLQDEQRFIGVTENGRERGIYSGAIHDLGKGNCTILPDESKG